MVSKITIFEPHFDGAQFGPKTIDAEALGRLGGGSSPAEETRAPESSAGRSRALALLFVLVALVAVLAYRKSRS